MFLFIIAINLISVFSLTCSLQNIRLKYKQSPPSLKESICYKVLFIVLNIFCLMACVYMHGNPGWIIWINTLSINALLIALLIGFYPWIYKKWILFTHNWT